MTARAPAVVALVFAVASVGPSRAETPVERGGYLAAIAACTGCHTPRTPAAPIMSGGVAFGGPNAPLSANITPDRETGIGAWTDLQIATAIRSGVRPDGTRIGAPMPQRAYRGLSDADLAAIVAFLRSVPPVHNLVERRHRVPGPSEALSPSGDRPAAIKSAGYATRGRYLFEVVAHCADCHQAEGGTRNGGSADSRKTFAGPHGVIAAPILSPASLAGLSDAELAAIITRGKRSDGSKLEGPMPVAAYAHLNAADLAAIIELLRGNSLATPP